MTKCSKCGKNRKHVHVHSHRIMKNGDRKDYYWCRDCNTARQRKFRSTKAGVIATRKAVAKSIDKHRHKHNARTTLNYHIRKGHIIRPKQCPVCKKYKKVEGHHEDYSKPLEVKWVCRQCHCVLK